MVAQTLLTPIGSDRKNELLIDRFLKITGIRDKWKTKQLRGLKFEAFPNANSLLADSIISHVHNIIIKQNLTVAKPDKDGNIINVTTTSTDEFFAKAFTDYLIKNATEFYMATMTKRQSENVSILQRQVDSVKILLNTAISGVAASTDAVPNLNPAYQRLKVPSQKKVVDVEMNKAILEQLVANLELAKIDLRKESPLVQVIDSPVLPLERKKVGKLKGIFIGGLLGGFLIVIALTLSNYFKLLLRE